MVGALRTTDGSPSAIMSVESCLVVSGLEYACAETGFNVGVMIHDGFMVFEGNICVHGLL